MELWLKANHSYGYFSSRYVGVFSIKMIHDISKNVFIVIHTLYIKVLTHFD